MRKFFIDLAKYLKQITTPMIYDFFKQLFGVVVITSFFSLFFYGISFVGLKIMRFVYGV